MAPVPAVNVQRRGPVRVLEIARPASGNALSAEVVAGLSSALAEARADGARAVVLVGKGRHFCSGADLRELAASADAPLEHHAADASRLGALYAELLRCPLLTLAAVRGAAYGGGAGLAAACDLVVAAPDARFQFSEVRLGFVPALVATFLSRRLGPATLTRLVVDPQPLAPEAALAVGLVDRVDEEPRAAAEAWAGEIAHKAAASAIAESKRLMLAFALPRLDQQLADAARANARQRMHPECRRGVAAFLATKTFPDWLDER
jgi:methylglutaconyl-CoA hydratase